MLSCSFNEGMSLSVTRVGCAFDGFNSLLISLHSSLSTVFSSFLLSFILSFILSSLFLSVYLSLLNNHSVLLTLMLWPHHPQTYTSTILRLQIEYLMIVNKRRLCGTPNIGLVNDYNNTKYSSIFYPLFFVLFIITYVSCGCECTLIF